MDVTFDLGRLVISSPLAREKASSSNGLLETVAGLLVISHLKEGSLIEKTPQRDGRFLCRCIEMSIMATGETKAFFVLGSTLSHGSKYQRVRFCLS